MRKTYNSDIIPKELRGEDVYDIHYIFDNIEEVADYFCKTLGAQRDDILQQLHEYDASREEFGNHHYPRSASFKDTHISELDSGEYIVWTSY